MIELLASAFVFTADQFSKRIILRNFSEQSCLSLGPRLKLRRVTHGKPSFKRTVNRVGMVALWACSVAGLAGTIRWGHLFQSQPARISIGMAIGGATSNLFDCLRSQRVVDFIDLGFWRVFNLADLAIVVGIGLALVFLY